MSAARYDVVVIGGGPSGHRASIEAAKAGRRVLLIERDAGMGGECVKRGTIPSKTLRESAIYLTGLRQRSHGVIAAELPAATKVQSLMGRLKSVREAHTTTLERQLERAGVETCQGRASFVSDTELEVQRRRGGNLRVHSDVIVVSTGSRPRKPDNVPVDHEHILDSDSILSLIYLPKSLVVLGGGVIACEFATLFAALGVEVTIIDKNERPLGFLDEELGTHFVRSLEGSGVRFLGGRHLVRVGLGDLASVVIELEGGESILAEKCLCALGRVANVAGLNLEAAGLEVNPRGHLPVDEHGQTSSPHVWAVGDVVGPPALAATAKEQGMRAIRHALGLPANRAAERIPTGIYAIPEMASVGLTEAQARERHGDCLVGRADYADLARGTINGQDEGFVKLVADPTGQELLGAHILGEHSTEIIHMAQLVLHGHLGLDAFLSNVFNFPTLAEGYQIAAQEIEDQLLARRNGLRAA